MTEDQREFLNRMKSMQRLRNLASGINKNQTTSLPKTDDGFNDRLKKAMEELDKMKEMQRLLRLAEKLRK